MITLATEVRPQFARHETFYPRFGWLRKGFNRASQYPDIFIRPDATVELGVGKNMVNAIRYWCQAFKVIAPVANPARPRVPWFAPTPFGVALFSEDGWDPYLEIAASLWILHWELLKPPSTAPVWWLAFNQFDRLTFTEDDVFDLVRDTAEEQDDWKGIAAGSIRKDVDCLLKMYAPARRRVKTAADELVDSPFRELHLIQQVPGDASLYQFSYGVKPDLPDEVVAYAILDFIAMRDSRARTMSLSRLATEKGSPGRVFKLPETSLADALRGASKRHPGIELADVAGLRQLILRDDPATMRDEAVSKFYLTRTGSRRSLRPNLELPFDS